MLWQENNQLQDGNCNYTHTHFLLEIRSLRNMNTDRRKKGQTEEEWWRSLGESVFIQTKHHFTSHTHTQWLWVELEVCCFFSKAKLLNTDDFYTLTEKEEPDGSLSHRHTECLKPLIRCYMSKTHRHKITSLSTTHTQRSRPDWVVTTFLTDPSMRAHTHPCGSF